MVYGYWQAMLFSRKRVFVFLRLLFSSFVRERHSLSGESRENM